MGCFDGCPAGKTKGEGWVGKMAVRSADGCVGLESVCCADRFSCEKCANKSKRRVSHVDVFLVTNLGLSECKG